MCIFTSADNHIVSDYHMFTLLIIYNYLNMHRRSLRSSLIVPTVFVLEHYDADIIITALRWRVYNARVCVSVWACKPN